MNTKEKVNWAFKELRKKGYYARQNYWCCQTCAWNDVPDNRADKVVFYHRQDAEAWDGKELSKDLYLAWQGDCKEIVQILNDCGLKTDHDGTNQHRIKVLKTL